MRTTFFLTMIMCLSLLSNCQTQVEINYNAKVEYEKSDSVLNVVFKTIILEYKSDTIFIKHLKEAQRQWVKFRDAQLKMRYPYKNYENGSDNQLCKYIYLKELTDTRVKDLQLWLIGIEEGDVCTGSVRIIE